MIITSSFINAYAFFNVFITGYVYFKEIDLLYSQDNNIGFIGCSKFEAVASGGIATRDCPVVARYIRLQTTTQSPNKNKLTICEVEVYGYRYVENGMFTVNYFYG
jgi:hypothetical protein